MSLARSVSSTRHSQPPAIDSPSGAQRSLNDGDGVSAPRSLRARRDSSTRLRSRALCANAVAPAGTRRENEKGNSFRVAIGTTNSLSISNSNSFPHVFQNVDFFRGRDRRIAIQIGTVGIQRERTFWIDEHLFDLHRGLDHAIVCVQRSRGGGNFYSFLLISQIFPFLVTSLYRANCQTFLHHQRNFYPCRRVSLQSL